MDSGDEREALLEIKEMTGVMQCKPGGRNIKQLHQTHKDNVRASFKQLHVMLPAVTYSQIQIKLASTKLPLKDRSRHAHPETNLSGEGKFSTVNL